MIAKNLHFLPRDQRDFSPKTVALREYGRIKGKSLKHILLDRFLNQYGYDKGAVTAQAIIADLLALIEQYYRYSDNSFLKQGQMVWHAVPVDEYPKKGKSMAQTKLKPVVLDIITDSDIEDMKTPLHHRELRLKKIERWTTQTYDQGALLSQLDLAVLLNTSSMTAGEYVREYHNLYHRPLPTRGNIQLIGGGQTHKKQIIALHLKGYLVPTICQKINHSKEAVERYIRDFESVKLLSTKFDDIDVISRIIRLTPAVVKQYLDLVPLDS
ncbi:MAG: DUF1670 domain-containing protein [Bacteroidota bacterium]